MKRRILLATSVLYLTSIAVYAQVSIHNGSGTDPNASSMLDVQSTDSGVLIPRMTEAQRNAIASPATSLLVYQTNGTPGYYFNSGTPASPVWTRLTTTSGTVTSIFTGTGISGGPITGSGTISLDQTYTDDRYVNRSGDVMTGMLTLNNSTSNASLNIPHIGTSNPTTVNPGDVWHRSNNLYYVQSNGTVRAIAHTGSWSAMGIAEIEAATAATNRFMTAERLKYAIEYHAPVQTADLHAPVTLAGQNYLSLSGQQITAGQIDLTSNVTGVLPVARGGSGAGTLSGYLQGNGTSPFTATATIPWGDIAGAPAFITGEVDPTWTGAANTTSNISRDGNVTLNSTGSLIMGGTCCIDRLQMNNSNISAANHITIADPGINEGLAWNGTSANWVIDVSPLARTNADGNLNLHGTANNIALWRPTLFVSNSTNYATATPQTTGGLHFTSTGNGHLTFSPGGTGNVGVGTTSPAQMLDVNGVINSATGYRFANTNQANGTYLRSSGTNFIPSTIQAADLPDLSGTYIRNQEVSAQATSNFWISGRGTFGNGTQTDPSVTFTSNRAIGLFRAGTNILGISTSGIERMRIAANGTVQIGTQNEQIKALDTRATANANGTRYGIQNQLTISDAASTANRTSYAMHNRYINNASDASSSAANGTRQSGRALHSQWDQGANMGAYQAMGSYSYAYNNTGVIYHSLYGSYSYGRNRGSAPTYYGAYNYAHQDLAAATSSNGYGAFNYAYNAAGTTTNAFGAYNYALSNDGTMSNARGSYNRVRSQGSAVITNAYGVQSFVERNAGTMTNGYAFYGSFSGTIGTKWGVYVTGEDRNYFSGNVGIGQTAPTYHLHVNGRIGTNAINETSDGRLKRDISSLDGSLEKVLSMRGVTYRWRTDEFPEKDFDEGLQYGLIAQELELVIPELVHTDSEGWKAIEYSHIVPLLIEAIKEQQQEIARLQQIEAREKERDRRLDEMEAAMRLLLEAPEPFPATTLVRLDDD